MRYTKTSYELRTTYKQYDEDRKILYELDFEMEITWKVSDKEKNKKPSVTETELQRVFTDKDKYFIDTPIADYDNKFMTDWVIKYWDQIMLLIAENWKGDNE